MSIGSTIYEQLGGRKFAVMTGAKNFVATADGLNFSLPGGGGFCKGGINRVRITLTPQDLYDVEFLRVRRVKGSLKAAEVSKAEGVYCDQLAEVFEQATGLYTKL